ncbi:Pectinesterase QRT1 [Camellia lanceoleosa]|uniref:Pectinesterase QRT1 n=1 Tax=Camellia lanceoleosa TaxID=1840588 RepID=A0ACC0H7N8_9ERIC|nr:Pectinesterase QRT1 [Camellia lanceoleosa]
MQDVALRLAADKTMLYKVRVLGTQDTLLDNYGSHYLYQYYIQGSVDFIFGKSRSLCQDCVHSTAERFGAIAAHHRDSNMMIQESDKGISWRRPKMDCSTFVLRVLKGLCVHILGFKPMAHSKSFQLCFSNCLEDSLIHRIIINGSWNKDTLLARRAWVALDEFDRQTLQPFFALSASTAEAKACLDAA